MKLVIEAGTHPERQLSNGDVLGVRIFLHNDKASEEDASREDQSQRIEKEAPGPELLSTFAVKHHYGGQRRVSHPGDVRIFGIAYLSSTVQTAAYDS